MRQKELTLVVMAAGMGSRFGGLKQITPVGPHGEMIMDYSIYDALRAGFTKIVFVIKEENRKIMEEMVGSRIPNDVAVEYVYQKLEDMPQDFFIPEGRTKPWGTAHAVYAARHSVATPFTVINADDYYGPMAFEKMADFLREQVDETHYAMVGYPLNRTLTEHGSVSRGICKVNADGELESIREYSEIYAKGENAEAREGDKRIDMSGESTLCSMNFWGFSPSLFSHMDTGLQRFKKKVEENPLKAEWYLPALIQEQMEGGKIHVQVLSSKERWYGVTYAEDKEAVAEGLRNLTEKGLYPQRLLGTTQK